MNQFHLISFNFHSWKKTEGTLATYWIRADTSNQRFSAPDQSDPLPLPPLVTHMFILLLMVNTPFSSLKSHDWPLNTVHPINTLLLNKSKSH